MRDTVIVRDAEPHDVEAITTIANAFITTTTIDWTEVEYTVDERSAWLQGQQAAGCPVLVAAGDDGVVGWASFGEFRNVAKWPGYRLTIEHTIHVREDHWGSGVGRQLMETLMQRARDMGKHVIVAAVSGENEGSI